MRPTIAIASMVATQRDHQEGRLLLALQIFNNTPNAKIRFIARLYDVPHATLAAHLHGHQPRHEFQYSHHRLIPTEEVALEQWILSMDEQDLPLRVATVQRMANLFLTERVQLLSN